MDGYCRSSLFRFTPVGSSSQSSRGSGSCAQAAAGVSRRRVPDPLTTHCLRIWQVYEKLSAVPNGRFTVAAAFGNVHGVYAPGNAELDPAGTRGPDSWRDRRVCTE